MPYIPGDIAHNVETAVNELRKVYWENDLSNVAAEEFKKAEDIIISAIVFGDYTVIRQTERGNNMNFGEAIEKAKNGAKIQRSGWNGKNQYVELATCISYKNAAGEIVNADHDAIGNKALAFVGTSGVQIGWLASQADMLADDWKIV